MPAVAVTVAVGPPAAMARRCPAPCKDRDDDKGKDQANDQVHDYSNCLPKLA